MFEQKSWRPGPDSLLHYYVLLLPAFRQTFFIFIIWSLWQRSSKLNRHKQSLVFFIMFTDGLTKLPFIADSPPANEAAGLHPIPMTFLNGEKDEPIPNDSGFFIRSFIQDASLEWICIVLFVSTSTSQVNASNDIRHAFMSKTASGPFNQ